MYKIMRRHRLQIHSHIQAFDDRNARTIRIISLRKSAFNAYVLFIVLVICYSPYLVVCILHFIGKAGELGLLLSSTVVFLNSALNPFLYYWRVREIRLAVLRTFRNIVSREWDTKTLSFTCDKFASWTKIAMKVKRHYGLQTTFFAKLQTGSKIFFHTTLVHSMSALVTAP